jgi:hypothetical protein
MRDLNNWLEDAAKQPARICRGSIGARSRPVRLEPLQWSSR